MDWEIVLSFAIVLIVAIAVFRSGQGNPVSTGELVKRISKVEKKTADDLHRMANEMQALEGRFAASATKTDIAALRTEIAEAATARSELAAQELGKIKDRVTTVCEKVEGLEKAADRTEQGVQRIENFFLQKGIEGR